MKKIKMDIVGLSYSQTQSGAYALVLGEDGGKRRLPIIIGGFEAQAIALELEKMTPARPLTHDLFKNFAKAYEISLNEVLIYDLVEGIFYAKLICFDGKKITEIESRTSDAIAIAVRFGCPIYTYEAILSNAGILMDEKTSGTKDIVEKVKTPKKEKELAEKDLPGQSLDELNELLKTAIDSENYERASIIRDEMNRRKKSQ